jgi:hypothetical protein
MALNCCKNKKKSTVAFGVLKTIEWPTYYDKRKCIIQEFAQQKRTCKTNGMPYISESVEMSILTNRLHRF